LVARGDFPFSGERWRQVDSWGLLSSKLSLTGKLQVSEAICLKRTRWTTRRTCTHIDMRWTEGVLLAPFFFFVPGDGGEDKKNTARREGASLHRL
jgi:hypothetical protein